MHLLQLIEARNKKSESPDQQSPLAARASSGRWLVGGLLCSAVVSAGIAAAYWMQPDERLAEPKAVEPPRAARFDADERRAIEALQARLKGHVTPLASEAVPGRSNAEILTYIAETSEDARVIAAALREVPTIYSSRSSQKLAPDADLERVLLKHLRAEDPSVFLAALAAARIPLMTAAPSDALTSAVAEPASPEHALPRRSAALEALGLLRPDRRSAHVLAAFERALSATEPHLISLALLLVSQSGPSLAAQPEDIRTRVAQRVLELGTHPDPGVRGRSLAVLSEVESLVNFDARFAAAQQHLADPHGYVRGQAADLLMRCREPMAIHALIASAGDLSEARYELSGWTTLDGNPGSLLHAVPGRQRVAEAALLAMSSLSQDVTGLNALVLTLLGRPQPEAVVLQNAELARAWYRTEAARIPRTPVRTAVR